MANTKTTDLTATTTVATSDIIYIVDGGASRQISIANLTSGGLPVGVSATQTLTNKTLTTPTIGDFTNATHDHADAAGGGNTLTTPTIGDFTNATHDHSDAAGGGSLVSASTTVSGAVEIATAAETTTGTDAGRAVSPDGLQGSFRNLRFVTIVLVASGTDVTVDTTIAGDFTIPFSGTFVQDDSNPDYFAAYTDTAGSTGTMVVDVHLNGTTIMDTNKLDIETDEKDTSTATTQPDLTTTTFSAGDILTFDTDSIHSGTAAKGLKVTLALRPD